MTTLSDLRPGDIMFARKVRPVAADLLILGGQLMLGQPGWPHHVGVVTQAQSDHARARMVQAMPSGAEEIELSTAYWTGEYTYLRPNYGGSATTFGNTEHLSQVADYLDQRALMRAQNVAEAASGYIGTPYSFADYAAIGAHHLSGEGYAPIEERNWLQKYVASSKHMICSQLADQALCNAGFHVFTDGRLPQDVTPAALYRQLRAMPGTITIRPGITS